VKEVLPPPRRVAARERTHDSLPSRCTICSTAPTPGVLGVFGTSIRVDAIKKLRAGGIPTSGLFHDPRHEIEDALDQAVSPVRMLP